MENQVNELVRLLEAETDHYRSLEQVLIEESRAGAAGQTAALIDAVDAKQSLLAKVRDAEYRRGLMIAGLLQSVGLSCREMTLSALADRVPDPLGSRLRRQGEMLRKQVQAVRRLNRSNGDLMDHCLKLVRRSLAMLDQLVSPQLVYQPAGPPMQRQAPVRRHSHLA
jgi:flagellar biosynthesis/type III secretory pathway chaperone